MNQEWIKENFLTPRHLQNRTRIPNPENLRAVLATVTSLRLNEERMVRNFLAEPGRYEIHNYYSDTEERIRNILESAMCCYCGDIPVKARRNDACIHRSCICDSCLTMYFRNYRFRRACRRKFKDGTRCTELAQFRLRDLSPSTVVHVDNFNCAHGFVFSFKEADTLEFRCPAVGCDKLCSIKTMSLL